MHRILLSFLFLTMLSSSGLFNTSTAFAQNAKAYFVDILYLQKGKSPADAKAYFNKVVPVIARHGLKRITPAFVVTKNMSGSIDPQLVNVWSVGDPKNTFANIFADKAYLKHVKLRNSIFDMKRSHMFMLKSGDE